MQPAPHLVFPKWDGCLHPQVPHVNRRQFGIKLGVPIGKAKLSASRASTVAAANMPIPACPTPTAIARRVGDFSAFRANQSMTTNPKKSAAPRPPGFAQGNGTGGKAATTEIWLPCVAARNEQRTQVRPERHKDEINANDQGTRAGDPDSARLGDDRAR